MCAIAVKMKTSFPQIVIACSYFLILVYTSNIIPLPQTVSLVLVYSFFIHYEYAFVTSFKTEGLFYVVSMVVMKICICLRVPVVCYGIHYHGILTLVYISIRFPYYYDVRWLPILTSLSNLPIVSY